MSDLEFTESKEKKVKRKSLKKNDRFEIWCLFIGRTIAEINCLICDNNKINQGSSNWHASHVISHKNGGSDVDLNNYRPLCSDCNLGMGEENMKDYLIRRGNTEALKRLKLDIGISTTISKENETKNKTNKIKHSVNDQPYIDGKIRQWYKNGKLHRDGDRPAFINGKIQVWYKDGKVYRDNDKPTGVYGNNQMWTKNNVFHRDGDKPSFISGEIQKWYKNGKLHRDGNKPAVINDGYREWYKNGVYIDSDE